MTHSIETDEGMKYVTGKCLWEDIRDPEFTMYCANLFGNYQNGFLPAAGGTDDQLYWVSQVIGCMSANKNRIDRERQEEEEKNRKR